MEETKLNELLQGVVDALPDAQKEAFLSCETVEDVVALAGKTGVALPDALLEAVAGGKVQLTGCKPLTAKYQPDTTKKFSDLW